MNLNIRIQNENITNYNITEARTPQNIKVREHEVVNDSPIFDRSQVDISEIAGVDDINQMVFEDIKEAFHNAIQNINW